MIDETLWTGHVVGRVLGAPGGEGRVSFRILHILEFRDGKISRENVWIDIPAIMRQLGQAASAAKEETPEQVTSSRSPAVTR